MNNKTKIHDYACSVVNFDAAIKCLSPSISESDLEYNINDAVHEWRISEVGGEWLLNEAKHKNSGSTKLNYQEELITHTVKALTKLYNEGYQLEVK